MGRYSGNVVLTVDEKMMAQYRELGLPAPANTPPHIVKEYKKFYDRLLSIYLRGDPERDGWDEAGRKELGLLHYEHFLKGKSRKEAGIRQAHLMHTIVEKFGMSEALYIVVGLASARGYCLDMAEWCKSGFPKVIADSKLAAVLMSTGLCQDASEVLIPPWPSFMVEIPESPLVYKNLQGDSNPVNTLYVSYSTVDAIDPYSWRYQDLPHGAGYWSVAAYSGVWDMWTIGATTGAMVEAPDTQEAWISAMGQKAEKHSAQLEGFLPDDKRRLYEVNAKMGALALRFVAGLCLTMSDPENVRKQKPDTRPSIRPKHQRGLPLTQTYVVGKPVSIDCREAVRQFQETGEKRPPNVQTLVRGHWKMQAWGPNHSFRRPQHILPYWKGAEDAPINVRPHYVKKS